MILIQNIVDKETIIEYSRYVERDKSDMKRKNLDETAGAVIKGNFPDAGAAGHVVEADGKPVPG